MSWGSSGGGSPRTVDVTQDLEQSRKELALVEQVLTVYKPLSGEIKDLNLSSFIKSLRLLADEVPGTAGGAQPKAMILGDTAPLEGLADHISRFRMQLLPRSFWIVLGLLALLVIVGVLWPLAALPGLPPPYSKGWMLFAFAAGLVGLIGYFAFELWGLTRLGRLSWEIVR